MKQGGVGENRKDVGHVAMLALPQMAVTPTVYLDVKENKCAGQQCRKEIHQRNDDSLVLPRQEAQVTEGENQQKRQQGKVEGRGDLRYEFCCGEQESIVHNELC